MRKLIVYFLIIFFAGCKSGDLYLNTSYKNSDNNILTFSKDSTFKIQRYSHSLISSGCFIGKWTKNKDEINFENFLNRNKIPIQVTKKEQSTPLIVEVNFLNEYKQEYEGTVDFYIKAENKEFYLGSLEDNKNIYNFFFEKKYKSFQIIAKYKRNAGLVEITKFDDFQTAIVELQENENLYCKLEFRFDYFDIETPENSFCKSYRIKNLKLINNCSNYDNWVLR
jgi:hypothetical protein